MYEGPMQSTADRQAEDNEYLMGKEVRGIRLLYTNSTVLIVLQSYSINSNVVSPSFFFSCRG